MKPEHRGTARWQYKREAITDAGRALAGGLRLETRANSTFVPIPPSKLPGDPLYDDRILQLVNQISTGDVRPLIASVQSREAAHENDGRRDPAALRATLRVTETMLAPRPTMIVLVDDLLTTGRSFRVCHDMIREHLADVRIVGLFVARRALPPPNFDFFDLSDF